MRLGYYKVVAQLIVWPFVRRRNAETVDVEFQMQKKQNKLVDAIPPEVIEWRGEGRLISKKQNKTSRCETNLTHETDDQQKIACKLYE